MPKETLVPRIDLRTIDRGRLIVPSRAEDKSSHILSAGDLNIPAEFKLLDSGHFRLNGVLKEVDSSGFVVSGYVAKNKAKINHIIVDEKLRDYAKTKNVRLGEALLADLENSFHEKNINDIYATFYTPKTIDFFLRNGYQISPIAGLGKQIKSILGVSDSDFNKDVASEYDYRNMLEKNPDGYKQILLHKLLENSIK